MGIGDVLFSSPLSSVSLSLSGWQTEQSRRGRSRADELSHADGSESRGAAVCGGAGAGFHVLRRPLLSSSLLPFPLSFLFLSLSLSVSPQMRWGLGTDMMGIPEPLAGDVGEPQLLFPRERRCSSPHTQLNPFPFPCARSSLLSPGARIALLFPSHLFRPAVSASANPTPWRRLLAQGDAICEEAAVSMTPVARWCLGDALIIMLRATPAVALKIRPLLLISMLPLPLLLGVHLVCFNSNSTTQIWTLKPVPIGGSNRRP